MRGALAIIKRAFRAAFCSSLRRSAAFSFAILGGVNNRLHGKRCYDNMHINHNSATIPEKTIYSLPKHDKLPKNYKTLQ